MTVREKTEIQTAKLQNSLILLSKANENRASRELTGNRQLIRLASEAVDFQLKDILDQMTRHPDMAKMFCSYFMDENGLPIPEKIQSKFKNEFGMVLTIQQCRRIKEAGSKIIAEKVVYKREVKKARFEAVKNFFKRDKPKNLKKGKRKKKSGRK